MHTKVIQTKPVQVRGIPIGGDNPIVIQSMTNTNTADAQKTAAQILELHAAGSEIVRITVDDEAAAQAVPKIRQLIGDIPLVGDFHYNGHTLLSAYPEMAQALDKYRINPGNVGYGHKHNYNIETIIKIALKYKKPIRIGVNWGSLDRELLTEMMNANDGSKSDREVIIDAMVESAARSTKLCEEIGHTDLILSVKMSEVPDMIKAYELLHAKNLGYPLHLGLTEAGQAPKGLISSAAALSILLHQNIGDTIRISLTPKPGAPRTEEVQACKLLLQSLHLRRFSPDVTSCPGCGRTESDLFLKLTEKVQAHLAKHHPDQKDLKVAVMGCIVNGPGESQHADIGISLPGKGEALSCPVYIRGKFHKNLSGPDIEEQFLKILDEHTGG